MPVILFLVGVVVYFATGYFFGDPKDKQDMRDGLRETKRKLSGK